MNKQQGNEIDLRLIDILNRPYRGWQKGEQAMQNDAKEHGKCTQGIEVMVTGLVHNQLRVFSD